MTVSVLARFQVRHLYPVFPIVLAVVAAAVPIRDNSFLWHVRAGSVQLASGRVLTRDPFSYVAEGEAWRTQSWLAELFYAFAESAFGGIGWAAVMVGAVLIGTLSVMAVVSYANVRSTLSTAAWLFILAWLLMPFSQPRPVVFSYLLLALLVMSLALHDRVLWAVVPIMWLWAGVHGSWFIGLGLVLLVAISRRSFRTAAVGGVATAATLATAHGIGMWGIASSFVRNASALDYIQEWNAPDFGGIAQSPYLIIVVALIVGAVRGRVTMSDLWVIVPFMLLGFTSQRTVPVAALVLLPFAARSVRITLPDTPRRLHAIPWMVLMVVLAIAVATYMIPRDELDSDRFPSDAAIAAVGLERFFHDDAVGGYLIYSEGPGRLVYVDDRVELYGAVRFGEFIAARDGDYKGVFERLGLSAALVRPDWPLRRELLGDGWHITYEDGVFEVLVPPGR